MARKKSPRVLAAVLVATSVAAISYKIYDMLRRAEDEQNTQPKKGRGPSKSLYKNKSIALTLLHSVLSLGLPLNDILVSLENVTFILPPYLSLDDLQIEGASGEGRAYDLPQSLLRNYKLLECSNIDGYFHLLKNLRPDMLFVCSDDLGIDQPPPDLRRFVKEIVTIDQDKDNVYNILSEVFLE